MGNARFYFADIVLDRGNVCAYGTQVLKFAVSSTLKFQSSIYPLQTLPEFVGLHLLLCLYRCQMTDVLDD